MHNKDYMTSKEEALSLATEISEALQVEAAITAVKIPHEDRANETHYTICVPFEAWKGRFIPESNVLFVNNPEAWEAFKAFLLRSATFLGYEQMDKDFKEQDESGNKGPFPSCYP